MSDLLISCSGPAKWTQTRQADHAGQLLGQIMEVQLVANRAVVASVCQLEAYENQKSEFQDACRSRESFCPVPLRLRCQFDRLA